MDFYTELHWQKLNKSVREFFDATDPPDWAWLLAQNPVDTPRISRKVAPLSLLALKRCGQHLSLNRTAIDLNQAETVKSIIGVLENDSTSKKACLDEKVCSTDDKTSVTARPFEEANYKNGQCMDMQHIFRKHVKPKKQHEIQQLGQVINILSATKKCKSVVDVGAGLGHLSRLLTFSHGLKVTTVEAADGHAPKAAEFDRELKKDVLKKLKKEPLFSSNEKLSDIVEEVKSSETGVSASRNHNQNVGTESSSGKCDNVEHTDRFPMDEPQEDNLPNHVVCYIQPDIAATQFLEIVKKAESDGEHDNQGADAGDGNFILSGLHTCGDLAPTLLKVFVNCPSALALASVACCYMKMDACLDNGESMTLENYPMSLHLKQQDHHDLNYETREMACHFADAYYQRLLDNPVHLKIHSYRAALQYLIKTLKPDYSSGQTRLVCKKGAQLSFSQYASEVLKKSNIGITTVPEELMQQCEALTIQWKRVVAFYSLRLSLAPVVETLILLDRILFLKEFGFNSALVPIFDSRISPRNFVLLATKL